MSISEEDVHKYIEKSDFESLLPEFKDNETKFEFKILPNQTDDEFISLWRILKKKSLEKIERIHYGMYEANIVSSKLKLPIDRTRPMELDFVGVYESGVFIIELKVAKSAERNAFTELLGYSNYYSTLFGLSSSKDITNILISKLEAKITKQAYLYDLIINDRNTLVYDPIFSGNKAESLKLEPYIPSDEEYKHFTNTLLSHENMSCVVVSFHDIEEWFDSKEDNGSLNFWTKEHLSYLSDYAAQLMESEGLHGFCYVRKPWNSIPLHYRNSLIICAVDPFISINGRLGSELSKYMQPESIEKLTEHASGGFLGRLIRLGQKAIKDTLTADHSCEVECPLWSVFYLQMIETVFTHNFGFRPTGILREAYSTYINSEYDLEAVGEQHKDYSVLKVNEIYNWLRAWEFMRACGFIDEEQ